MMANTKVDLTVTTMEINKCPNKSTWVKAALNIHTAICDESFVNKVKPSNASSIGVSALYIWPPSYYPELRS